MAVIERIRDELRLPSRYVTHDATEVERLAGARVTISRA
jgi:ABC-type molybdate transport system ATPase subunit